MACTRWHHPGARRVPSPLQLSQAHIAAWGYVVAPFTIITAVTCRLCSASPIAPPPSSPLAVPSLMPPGAVATFSSFLTLRFCALRCAASRRAPVTEKFDDDEELESAPAEPVDPVAVPAPSADTAATGAGAGAGAGTGNSYEHALAPLAAPVTGTAAAASPSQGEIHLRMLANASVVDAAVSTTEVVLVSAEAVSSLATTPLGGTEVPEEERAAVGKLVPTCLVFSSWHQRAPRMAITQQSLRALRGVAACHHVSRFFVTTLVVNLDSVSACTARPYSTTLEMSQSHCWVWVTVCEHVLPTSPPPPSLPSRCRPCACAGRVWVHG
jgi:hypothetical protein